MLARLKRFGIDGFLLSLIGAVLLAALWPSLLKTGGLIRIDVFTTYGVALVFLLYGLTLSPQKMREGVVNWRLHAVVQAATFVLFPLLGVAFQRLFGHHLDPALALGVFYLCALPSTVSSSVAMTSIAKGNVPGAIFNASLSSLIGVFITPLWINAYLHAQGGGMALGPVILKIVLLVLLPIVIGQVLRPFVLRWIQAHLAAAKFLDRATILAIVANSFADSVAEGVWAAHGIATLLLIALISVLLFWAMFALTSLICRALGFDRSDRIAAIFCGSKKSLASGVPMAKIMFGGNPAIGLIIAPIMLFHLLQLIMVSIIARRMAASARD
ncbi:bile acid:sodium symporter [Niveibacterium umoris]|uniref:Sodium/bile acid cotransporter 7 n=1 Tax=Niveibacterium umoris TaxID=1193620 RepID=A0A840BNP0_9RHOO|nr:bile acid:sodium symporter family protein [Niveibacterium umoris]MBB4014925.1 sodium/bile acid cotransporter 7 [Niveibacterium umoris]